MKHTPAIPLRLLTADEVRKWPAMEGKYFLAVTDPEHAARLFNRDNAYPRLVEALAAVAACLEMAETYENERSGEHDAMPSPQLDRAQCLLRELGEVE